MAGRGWEEGEVGEEACPDSATQGGVWILFSVHSRAMDLIKTSVLLWGQLMGGEQEVPHISACFTYLAHY